MLANVFAALASRQFFGNYERNGSGTGRFFRNIGFFTLGSLKEPQGVLEHFRVPLYQANLERFYLELFC
jgi:hypothetical protein